MQAIVGALGTIWGLGGVLALLGTAILRLGPIGLEALRDPFGATEWTALAVSLLFFGYTEGYRAFQLQFAPRVVARAFAIYEQPSWLRVVLAPAFAMGFFGATRKRLIVSYSLSLGIVGLIALVRAVPQPWRGIVDLGVVLALAWGAVSIVVYAVQAWQGKRPSIATDIPPLSIDELVPHS